MCLLFWKKNWRKVSLNDDLDKTKYIDNVQYAKLGIKKAPL